MRAAGIVLCGGLSSRMGTPKATLPFGPETMLQRVVRLLEAVASPIVIVAAREQALPPLPSHVVVARDERDARGPLEGLWAGFKALPARSHTAFVTGCDAPLLVPGFVDRMVELLGDHDVAAVEADGHPYPLGAVYRRSVMSHIEKLLASERAGPVHLLHSVRARRVRPEELMDVDPDLLTLRNVNTPEDYQAALREARLADPAHARLLSDDQPS